MAMLHGRYRLTIIKKKDSRTKTTRYIARVVNGPDHIGQKVTVKFQNHGLSPSAFLGETGPFDGDENDIHNLGDKIDNNRQHKAFPNPFIHQNQKCPTIIAIPTGEKISSMYKRIIPPIGQGCCVEQCMESNNKIVRILYDCGSFQKESLYNFIDIMLQTREKEIKTYNILVISHFHADHINGIPYLKDSLKKLGKRIDKVILPEFIKDIKIKNLFIASILTAHREYLESNVDNTLSMINLIDSPDTYFSDSSIAYVSINGYPEMPLVDIVDDSIINIKQICQIKPSINNDIFWVMKFWLDKTIYDELQSISIPKIPEITKSMLTDPNQSVVKNILKSYREIITGGKINMTSMIMATFVYFNNKDNFIDYIVKRIPAILDIGFVCTGDYPFDTQQRANEIATHYCDQQFMLRQMMVPHHGSNKYCEYMPFDSIKCAHAQNSPRSKYKHPGKDTIRRLGNWGIAFINRSDF